MRLEMRYVPDFLTAEPQQIQESALRVARANAIRQL